MSIYLVKGEKTLSTGEVEDWFRSDLLKESCTAYSGDEVRGNYDGRKT